MKIVVLGAGIAGVMTAYELARAGHEVDVLERQAGPAEETSRANGGIVGGTQVEPWAEPGLPLKLLSWLGQENAPFLIRAKQLPKVIGWGRQFLGNCSAEKRDASLQANVRLTRYSLDRFAVVREEANVTASDYDLGTSGVLKVFATEEALASAAVTGARINDLGIRVEPVDRDGCAAREPAIRNVRDGIAGGLFYPEDETGDCHKFANTVSKVCENLGVRFHFGVHIRNFDIQDDRAVAVKTSAGPFDGDRFVVAMASYSPQLMKTLGIRVPVIPVKGVSITMSVRRWNDAVQGAVIDHSRFLGITRMGDRLRIAGSAEVAGFGTVPSPARCQAIIDNALSLFPDLAICLDDTPPVLWAGSRPVSPDGRPILGGSRVANIFLNTGHGPEGWSTSCGSAKVVADIVSDKVPDIDPTPYALARF